MFLSINLEGRITGENADEVEAAILRQLNPNINGIILDAKNLSYISSSGIRFIIRLKKAFQATSIINCNPFVYEILSLTGMTDIMDISKAI